MLGRLFLCIQAVDYSMDIIRMRMIGALLEVLVVKMLVGIFCYEY
jgi:hypothetical protein